MSDLLQPGQQIHSYRVVRKLGSGGMGAVYEAVHEQLQRRVAIKVLHAKYSQDPKLVARFVNEARAVNIVKHPNVVSVHDIGQLPDGSAFMIMEYLAGQPLSARLKWGGGRLGHATLRFARQIAAGLAAAHDKGIVHRDLKPDNVMVIGDPETITGERIKLVDFGIAKLTYQEGRGFDARLTTDAHIMGTPMYMAPEQCKGAADVDGKADVYSLGVILYQLLAGRPPFQAHSLVELIGMHLYQEPAPLLDVDPLLPRPLTHLVHAMLHKQPAMRPDMAGVATTLQQLGEGHAMIPVARRRARRKRALVGGAVAAIVVIGGAVVAALLGVGAC